MAKVKEPSATCAGKLTVRDVAQREHVSERTVLNWIEDGILHPEYRVGRVIRFGEDYVAQLKAASR